MIGITSFGAYIPKLRLDRQAIYQAMGWFAPALMTLAKGERSVCNWDEDALTMAVAASQDCLQGRHTADLDAVYLASTTHPFADRQNAGILAAALNLSPKLQCLDVSGSQKAGMSALHTALDSIAASDTKKCLVTASDLRKAKPGSLYELCYGHGAAALEAGSSNVLAEFLGAYSLSYDFNDRFREQGRSFDTVWEERWSREEGYAMFLPEALQGLMDSLGLSSKEVDRVVFPCIFQKEYGRIANKLGLEPEKIGDNLHEVCGEIGCAHALLLLIRELEQARPGQVILTAGFGHGCEALAFRVTEKIKDMPARIGVQGSLANRKKLGNYTQYLVFQQLLEPELGSRAEVDSPTAQSVLWRNRDMLLGLVGGKCRQCGTPQFPKQNVCVNPDCGATDSQDLYEFAGRPARIKTYTGDMLASSLKPPQTYGMIEFDAGGRLLADLTDCELEELRVGLPVEMVFRMRMQDQRRGFRQYFWKARPLSRASEQRKKLDFSGQVAVITGAGGGLGRVYALELAQRGAKVVVNDLGGTREGSGGSKAAADAVVQAIQQAGGEALANYENIAGEAGGRRLIASAVEHFGRVDILINNAGILRDKSLVKMGPETWQALLDVHLHGAYHVTRPAFEQMRKQEYGRVVMTTSGAALYGNFGQSNYAAAKMALVGLMNTLKLEGESRNILVNTIAPLAASRLTQEVMPEDLFQKMKPEYVAPLVLFLASRNCRKSGLILNCGLGYANRAAYLTGSGVQLGDADNPPSVEQIAEHFAAIRSLDGAVEYKEANEALLRFLE